MPDHEVLRRIFNGDVSFMTLIPHYVPEIIWAILQAHHIPDPLQR